MTSNRGLTSLSIVLIATVAVNAAVDACYGFASFHRASLDSLALRSPGSVLISMEQSADHRVQVAWTGFLIVHLLAAVLTIVWLSSVVRLIAARRPGTLLFNPGWAIGGWFIPIFNWVRPKQIVDDAWRSSRPTDDSGGSVPWWVHAWWGAWFVFGLVYVGSSIARPADSDVDRTSRLHGFLVSDRAYGTAGLVDMVAAILLIVVVRALTRRAVALPFHPPIPTHGMRFNPAPGWPPAPEGWTPPSGWRPDPAWPPIPAGWPLWVPI